MKIIKKKKSLVLLLLAVIAGGVFFVYLIKTVYLVRGDFFRKLERANFVLISGKSQVFIFSFQGGEGVIVKFSGKEKVQVTRGFGEYEMIKVYPLGELDKKGGQLLKETLQESLYIPVFGYFYDGSELDYLKMKKVNFFSHIFFQSLKGKIKTDLKFLDLLILTYKLRRLSEDNIRMRDYQPDIGELFKDKGLRTESYSIEVLNSTSHFGLAKQISSLLENAGARVVRLSESPDKQQRCLLLANRDLLLSYTATWLTYVLDCQTKITPPGTFRADFSLIIGENFWEKLNEKW